MYQVFERDNPYMYTLQKNVNIWNSGKTRRVSEPPLVYGCYGILNLKHKFRQLMQNSKNLVISLHDIF